MKKRIASKKLFFFEFFPFCTNFSALSRQTAIQSDSTKRQDCCTFNNVYKYYAKMGCNF